MDWLVRRALNVLHVLQREALVARETGTVLERVVSALVHQVRRQLLEAVRILVMKHGLAVQLHQARLKAKQHRTGNEWVGPAASSHQTAKMVGHARSGG